MRPAHRNDPRLPAGRLLRIIPPAVGDEARAHDDYGPLYGRTAWARDVAADLGTTARTVTRWITAMLRDEPLSIYVLDMLAAREGVPLASLYPEAFDGS